jgi:hypothetical protein
MMTRVTRIAAVAATLLFAIGLRAQGSVAVQGFGYPPGQLTTRAASSGGGLSEFDQAGALNPAALMNWGVAGAYLQYSPERRTTKVDTLSSTATVARFPIFAIGLPAGQKYGFGITSSTLLERNYTTITTARQQIRTDSVTTTTRTDATGALNDIRFGGAMQVTPWLRVGTALHVITGENRLVTARSIAADTGVRADTVVYAIPEETSTATFGGTAVSFGVELAPTKKISVAGSARLGFRMRADLTDSTRLNADVPNRAGAAIRWEVGGANVAARYNWEGWSAMRGLSSSTTAVFDTREFGVGAELIGPKIRGARAISRMA